MAKGRPSRNGLLARVYRELTESIMTAAYLTELEITRELRLPDKIGRIAMATWKMFESFPKPAAGMGGRRWYPAVVDWLNALNGVGAATAHHMSIPLSGSKGETFHESRTARKARRAKRSDGAGPDLSTSQNRMGDVVVSAGGTEAARLPGHDGKVVAWRPRAIPR